MRASEKIYLEALRKIAAGEGYYGAQAREYKEIAQAAIAAGMDRKGKCTCKHSTLNGVAHADECPVEQMSCGVSRSAHG